MKNKLFLSTAVLFFVICFQTKSIAQGMSISASGSSPDNSAMLDVSSNNHGLLIPRVALTSLSDQTTIASPATYLTIYNTNTTVGNGTGMYYWSGTSWNYMASASNGNGSSGQVLTSQGGGQAPQWSPIPPSGGGGSICACFNAYQIFTSSGTFTTSSTTTLIKVAVWGGGGGGSGGGYNPNGIGGYTGAGGGGGGYAEGIFTVTPSTNYNITIGPGGPGGAPNNAGTNGGTSSFDVFISATGGGGATINNYSGGLAGNGGFGVGGYLNSSLGSGGASGYSTTFAAQAGVNSGGSSGGLYGGGGGGGVGGGNGGGYEAAGGNAQANSGAGGGGGGYYTATGGDGGSGMVVVYY